MKECRNFSVASSEAIHLGPCVIEKAVITWETSEIIAGRPHRGGKQKDSNHMNQCSFPMIGICVQVQM